MNEQESKRWSEDIKRFISEEHNLAEEFVRSVDESDVVVLWGAGKALCWYIRFLDQRGIRAKYIIDKNPEQQGKTIFELKVISVSEISKMHIHDSIKIVISAPKYKKQIMEEATSFFGKDKIYSFEAEIYYTFIHDLQGYKQYLLDNILFIQDLYNDLSDEKSRETLTAFIKGRVSANQDYFIDAQVPDQYFPRDIISLGQDEVIVEAGSNDGKTLEEMLNITKGKFKRIYCIEPDEECGEMLKKIISKSEKPITLIQKGVGESLGSVKFKTDSEMGASKVVKEGEWDYKIDITTIDHEITEKITMIKMDIEGLEYAALKGAERVIKKDMPKLAICVYHEKEDILRIWQYLKEMQPRYRFFLRHHNWGAAETVLYAVPSVEKEDDL